MNTKSFKVGSIVFATDQGLGIMAKSFYDNGIIDKVLIVKHSKHENHYEWYGDNWRDLSHIDWLLEDIDTLFLFETPFDWSVIPRARAKGIKVILQPNECTPYPGWFEPDIYHCPSLLEMDNFSKHTTHFLPYPTKVPFKMRNKALTFIHNVGHGGLLGRNGTKELIDAMEWVKSPIKLIIRSQDKTFVPRDPRIELRMGTVPYEELWKEGDVFIFPDKFAGLSLPLQEAYASGMLVITGDRYPLNTWLPKSPLIPIKEFTEKKIGNGIPLEYAVYDPKIIAQVIDGWYNKDIKEFSLRGKKFAKENSWEVLKPKYIELCKKKP